MSQVTVSATTRQPRAPRQGKALLERLRAAGIAAHDVTRNQRTGVFTVKFVDPNQSNFYSRGTDPAQAWAERIEAAMPQARIIDRHDSIADWRPGKPVLFATVFLVLESKSARTTEAVQTL